ncbi:hypothetical protein LZ31DRAFT_184925 [Colletotrichum somersetense]|nr:hypothetical protein LZ31DRAFT_184925 [Colletotrichum somersetense]
MDYDHSMPGYTSRPNFWPKQHSLAASVGCSQSSWLLGCSSPPICIHDFRIRGELPTCLRQAAMASASNVLSTSSVGNLILNVSALPCCKRSTSASVRPCSHCSSTPTCRKLQYASAPCTYAATSNLLSSFSNHPSSTPPTQVPFASSSDSVSSAAAPSIG